MLAIFRAKCIVFLYMKATVIDLRYRMKDVLRALDRNEEVTVLHRGDVKGTIVPKSRRTSIRVEEHPLFGDSKLSNSSVDDVMSELREGRRRGV